jgi:hypothetical protein
MLVRYTRDQSSSTVINLDNVLKFCRDGQCDITFYTLNGQLFDVWSFKSKDLRDSAFERILKDYTLDGRECKLA